MRRVGIGLVGGGVAFGALSFVGSVFAASGTLLGLGAVVWYEEYRRQLTVGIGLGIGLVGVGGVLEGAASTPLEPLEIAVVAVGAGVLDYLLAPAYGRLEDRGRESRKRRRDD